MISYSLEIQYSATYADSRRLLHHRDIKRIRWQELFKYHSLKLTRSTDSVKFNSLFLMILIWWFPATATLQNIRYFLAVSATWHQWSASGWSSAGMNAALFILMAMTGWHFKLFPWCPASLLWKCIWYGVTLRRVIKHRLGCLPEGPI